jgi:hypothetical protein
MSFTLQAVPLGSPDYPTITEANRAAIEAALNELDAKVSSVGGDGAQLILDAFDRDGVVGAASYQLDLKNYTGAAEIIVGRRPAADTMKGDQDVSIAFGTFSGVKKRVTQSGDVTLDASFVTADLPKTIYIAIPSDGTVQIYEDADLPNLVYVASMCWTGFALSQFKQLAHILPGFTLLQELAKVAACERIFDGSTDWLSHSESLSTVVLGGDGTENEIALNISREVVGGFIAATGIAEGFYAPAGPDNKLVLELWDDQDRRWNLEDIEIDCSATPTRLFFKIDPALGDDVFVTGVAEFRLVRTSIGGDVLSARRFSWGLYTRPVIGTPTARDTSKVDGL